MKFELRIKIKSNDREELEEIRQKIKDVIRDYYHIKTNGMSIRTL